MSWSGRVESINVATGEAGAGSAIETRESARLVADQGVEGDRYFGRSKPERVLTLIEAEAIEAVARDYDLTLSAGEARRNIVTRGVPLNHLVGREFTIGSVRLRGTGLSEPCEHLEELTQPGVRVALQHRGGLRAAIVEGGEIRVGDAVEARS